MLLEASSQFRIYNSNVRSYNISHEENSSSLIKSTIKTITTSIMLDAASFDYNMGGIIKLERNSSNSSVLEVRPQIEKRSEATYFYNSNYNETIVYTNEKLEVEDLAEKVTQSQLNEIKEHFDTKLLLVEKNIESKIDTTKVEILNSIENGKKATLNKWWVVAAFFGSTIIGPLIVEFLKQLIFKTP